MDHREGSSKRHHDDDRPAEPHRPAKRDEKMTDEQKRALEEQRRKEKLEYLKEPADSDEEMEKAERAGPKHYKDFWKRLKKANVVVDTWDFKVEGEVLTMRMCVEGENYSAYFTPRSAVDYQMRPHTWIPRKNAMFRALRTRLFSLPKTLNVNRLVIHNTIECEAEDCLIEMMFCKRWTCRHLDYHVTQGTEFTQPQTLRKLIAMFKPSELSISLNFGPNTQQMNLQDPNLHTHLTANIEGTLQLEKDFAESCTHALNLYADDPRSNKEVQKLYAEAGKGRQFGMHMLRTLYSIRKFMTMMIESRETTRSSTIRKFIIRFDHIGPTNEKICPKLQSLLKDERLEDASKKRNAYSVGDKIYVCVRMDPRASAKNKYSISLPATAFRLNIGNDQLLSFTKNVTNFQCLFRTHVDEAGVQQLISEWLKGERNIEEIQLHVDRVFPADFASQFNPDTQDPKKLKIRRVLGTRRWTMSIERERLTTRHLSLKVYEMPTANRA